MVEKTNIPINPEVAAVFDSYPEPYMEKLLFLRQLIFETAESLADVGPIEDTLKWGEPSYLTPAPSESHGKKLNQSNMPSSSNAPPTSFQLSEKDFRTNFDMIETGVLILTWMRRYLLQR